MKISGLATRKRIAIRPSIRPTSSQIGRFFKLVVEGEEGGNGGNGSDLLVGKVVTKGLCSLTGESFVDGSFELKLEFTNERNF